MGIMASQVRWTLTYSNLFANSQKKRKHWTLHSENFNQILSIIFNFTTGNTIDLFIFLASFRMDFIADKLKFE